jgi:hypothetical protein
MVISSITGGTTGVTVTDLPKIENNVTESSVVRKIENKEIESMMSTEQYVRQYFSDIPIMIQIAKCESTYKHLDSQGNVIKNKNSSATGVMQIMESLHSEDAAELGLDLHTIEGNTAYARELYEKQGTKPWNSSKACWGKYLTVANAGTKDLAINSLVK